MQRETWRMWERKTNQFLLWDTRKWDPFICATLQLRAYKARKLLKVAVCRTKSFSPTLPSVYIRSIKLFSQRFAQGRGQLLLNIHERRQLAPCLRYFSYQTRGVCNQWQERSADAFSGSYWIKFGWILKWIEFGVFLFLHICKESDCCLLLYLNCRF